MGGIDPRALVSPTAELAADVTVGAYSVIGDGVKIGPGTWVGPHAVVTGNTTLGAGNKVFQFASIGDAPQDLKYAGEPTRLLIGDRNVFREFTSMNRGTAQGGGVTTIGSDNLFMSYTHVAHDCHVGSRCVMANYATLGGHVYLGDWVIMGGYSGIHQFTKVGSHAFLGNNAAVTRDVPPYLMVVGTPAVPHSINSEGLKRRGFTPEQIRNLKNAYRVLYRSDLKLADAVAELTKRVATQPELKIFVDFIGESTRSLVR
ncbi:MAG TPA: acyl-ACP--UDP-N-acetylglucosamine O-acyltransferase [Steroidobacteraceae bacterium]|jgi:UDP-N-acetylglucosamine acyltransferase|nr:acyl-ACP--UDP-N-acetylglucosamine O-acyltransferase [Steroidobacteraceae bacterium]